MHVNKVKDRSIRRKTIRFEGEINNLKQEKDKQKDIFENERNEFIKRIQKLEEEKLELRSECLRMDNKLSSLQEKLEFEQEKSEEREKHLKSEYIDKNNRLEEERDMLQSRLRELELRYTTLEGENNKHKSLLESNTELSEKQVKML